MATNETATLVNDLLVKINTAPTTEEVDQAANDLAKEVKSRGLIMLKHHNILQKLEASAKNKKSGMERESGLIGFKALEEVVKEPIVPVVLDYLVLFLNLYADKGQVVQEAAELAARAIVI
ncbi:unnamed protein product [Cunninghamella blakesleeana]